MQLQHKNHISCINNQPSPQKSNQPVKFTLKIGGHNSFIYVQNPTSSSIPRSEIIQIDTPYDHLENLVEVNTRSCTDPANIVDFLGSEEILDNTDLDLDNIPEFKHIQAESRVSSTSSNLSNNSKKISKPTKAAPQEKQGGKRKRSQKATVDNKKGKKNPWSASEDAQVLDLINKHGECWTDIAKMIGSRTGKQVRDRYRNYLKSDINNAEFTRREDELLLELYEELGNKWRKIADMMAGRTECQIKNRYYTHLKKTLSNGLPSISREDESERPQQEIVYTLQPNVEEKMFDPTDVISYSSQNNENRDENDCFSRYVKAAIGGDQRSTSDCHERLIEICGGSSYDESHDIFFTESEVDFSRIEKDQRIEELTRRKASLGHLYRETISEMEHIRDC